MLLLIWRIPRSIHGYALANFRAYMIVDAKSPELSAAGVVPAQIEAASPQKTGQRVRKLRADERLSPDGNWEKMKRPDGLLRYVPTGIFFGRTRYKEKLIRKTLKTSDYDEACDRLPVYIKKWQQLVDAKLAGEDAKAKAPTTWKEAALRCEQFCLNRAKSGAIKHCTASDRVRNISKIAYFWPSIENQPVCQLKNEECLQFFADARAGEGRFAPVPYKGGPREPGSFMRGPNAAQTYNVLLGAARLVVNQAQKMDVRKGLASFEDPFRDVEWAAKPNKLPPLPSDAEWERILNEIINARSSAWSKEVYEKERLLAKFMSMTGARISEIIGLTKNTHKDDEPHPGFRWKDIREGCVVIRCAKKRKRESWKPRDVPWIDGMKAFIEELRQKLYKGDDDALVFEGIGKHGLTSPLRRAVKAAGLTRKLGRFPQHKIRHLFATKCVEAGVSFKTLAEWLGHNDGGVLAAETYSHLRPDCSREQAAKVSYQKKVPDASEPAPVVASVDINGQKFTQAEVAQMAAKFLTLAAQNAA